MRRNLRDFGFPVLVLGALAASGYLTTSVQVPNPVPDFALQAGAVYRLEVGGACFAALYLGAMALVLALDGRGFAEFRTKGLRATEVVRVAADEQEGTLAQHLELNHEIEVELEKTSIVLESAAETLKEQGERLAKLENGR